MNNPKDIYQQIRNFAEPYLQTRDNDLHTTLAKEFALELLKAEPGDEGIVVPAIILHDIGWARIPEELQSEAYGPKANAPEITRLHEEEGVKIAKKILEQIHYDLNKIGEILSIIDGHDTRKEAISNNDKIVKDADKLTRYDKGLHQIWLRRLYRVSSDEVERGLAENVDIWFFTETAKAIASRNIQKILTEKHG